MTLSQLKMKEFLKYLENFKFAGSHISAVRVTATVMAGKMFNIPIVGTMPLVGNDVLKRFDNPHEYYVDLSKESWSIKQELIKKYRKIEDSEE
jgi:hypothetical protein